MTSASVARPRSGRATAFAPGSVGNVGPGLDILGLAVTGPGDEVTATLIAGRGVRVADPGAAELSTDPESHASAIAAGAVLRRAGASDIAIELVVRKGLPLAGGQGGSAASAVAGALAANALLGEPLSQAALLAACLEAESRVAGRHLDNIAPSLLGGCVLVLSIDADDRCDVCRVSTPPELRVVLARPRQRLRTAEGRAALPASVSRELAMRQAAHVASIVLAFTTADFDLLGRSVEDGIAEPARTPLIPGFADAKAAALAAGALGCSISGSGPTAFAFARGDAVAHEVSAAMRQAYEARGISCEARIAEVDRRGARLL